jgi:hypothetical protein
LKSSPAIDLSRSVADEQQTKYPKPQVENQMFLGFRRQVTQFAFTGICVLAASIAASAGSTFSSIDHMTGWQTCARCAGPHGTGPATPHYVAYNIKSPSMDGRAIQFTNAGTVAYSDAIWWKQLGANSRATHFTYDLYFYIKNPAASLALEFDINQSVGGRKYVFGTQCGHNYDHQWDVWGNRRWNRTGVGCSVRAYAWNHLIVEGYRSNGVVHLTAITLNGGKHYVNRAYGAVGSGASEINVAFQMDQTSRHITHSVWLDKVKLTYW